MASIIVQLDTKNEDSILEDLLAIAEQLKELRKTNSTRMRLKSYGRISRRIIELMQKAGDVEDIGIYLRYL